ncbi:hypothetical protein ORI89_17400 [Sphingobacterium sp. UT-1RO-CII-1]|uniref:DUF6706 family protein n=1 Tax=Sphingobacterium sp. UT-1RO-CII-1 TaxID=2995225 RepID=UPI00227B4CC0|nr:DUF6706 family protein [Sphingobacterium sp. UT-1RO-CII-1]MCY4781439.1 hypothetical protein [Sphingobacterium sp. UT-1RO-CII-1]
MTNRGALQAKIGQRIKAASIDLVLLENGLDPATEYCPTKEENRRSIELAQAELLFLLCTNPKSVKELDYQITQHEIDQLLKLRGIILAKWGVDDGSDDDGPRITSVSDLW